MMKILKFLLISRIFREISLQYSSSSLVNLTEFLKIEKIKNLIENFTLIGKLFRQINSVVISSKNVAFTKFFQKKLLKRVNKCMYAAVWWCGKTRNTYISTYIIHFH